MSTWTTQHFSGLCNCGEPIALKVFSAKAETSDPVSITNETSLPSTLTRIFQYLLGLLISVTAFRYDVSIGSVSDESSEIRATVFERQTAPKWPCFPHL